MNENNNLNDNDIENQKEQLIKDQKRHQSRQQQTIDKTHLKTHEDYAKDKDIRNCFNLVERFQQRSKQLLFRSSQDSYVKEIDALKSQDLNEFEQHQMNGKIVQLDIHRTSNLELDQNILRPFVKIHFLNLKTGEYLKKFDEYKNTVTHYEKITLYEKEQFSNQSCKHILPFATKCCDLRIQGNSQATWNEVFYIDQEINEFMKKDTVILFELLDFNLQLIEDQPQFLDKNNYYRIAWGFYRPLGSYNNNCGQQKIQLYQYKFNSYQSNNLRFNDLVPEVYFDFNWPNKRIYPGYLQISFQPMRPQEKINVEMDPKHIFEIEKGQLVIQNADFKQKKDEIMITEKDKELYKRRRYDDQPCQVPDQLLYKFQSGPLGCYRMAISKNGLYLACACTQQNSKTIIKIFNLEDGSLVFVFKGHKNIIHEMDWQEKDQYLLTCSSDSTVKLWKIEKQKFAEDVEEEMSEKLNLKSNIIHPQYVYTAKFFPIQTFDHQLFIITGCFDSQLRVFYIQNQGYYYYLQQTIIIGKIENKFDKFDTLLQHRHPTSLQIDHFKKVYVGDSLGDIHIFDYQLMENGILIQKIKVLEQNITDISSQISQILTFNNKNNQLLVQAKDNLIRQIGNLYSDTRVINQFLGVKCQKQNIRSAVSPDGQYLISGSEDGKPYIWNVENNDCIDTEHLEISFNDPVCDVTWNSKYHMYAISGFGKDYPILVYIWERKDEIGQAQIEQILNYINNNNNNSNLNQSSFSQVNNSKKDFNSFMNDSQTANRNQEQGSSQRKFQRKK